MTINSYQVGNVVRVSVAFTLNSVATDPTIVILKLLTPNSNPVTYVYPTAIVQDSTGAYHYDITLTSSGTHYYRWEGSGAVTAADEHSFETQATVFS